MEPRKRKYWKVHLSRAWDGTKDELRKHSLIETVIAVSVLIVGINIDIFIVGSKLNQIIIHLLQGVGYLAVAFGLLFLIKSLSAHGRIYEETISSLREAKEPLEKQQEQLEIYFGIYWDKELNPYCPVCKTLLTLVDDSRPKCYNCDKIIPIVNSDKRMGLREARKIISSQQQSADSSGEQLPVKLKVNYKPGERPWVLDKQATSNGQDYVFRIELMNLGLEKVQITRIRLVEIKPDPRDEITVPCDLQLDSKDIHKTDKEGEGEFVDVFKYFRHSQGGNDHLWMIGSIENKGYKMKVQKYEKVKITVSSDNGGDIIKHFEFDPDEKDAKYCMKMIELRLGEKARELEKWIDKNITIEPDMRHNPTSLVKYRFESKLLAINNFCTTYRGENGKPCSVPLEKILLTRDDEHNRLMLLIKP